MLTPHVIERPEDFQEIVKRKMEEHREFADRFRRDGDKLVLGLDYRKKHGLLEDIHQSIRAARKEEAVLEELRKQENGPPLPQETDGLEDDSDEDSGDAKGEDDKPTTAAEQSAAPILDASTAEKEATDVEMVSEHLVAQGRMQRTNYV